MFSLGILSRLRTGLATAALLLAASAGASPALAVPLSVGTTISVSYERPFFLLPDLTGTLNLTVESLTSTQIVLGVDVTNTTSPWFLTSRLASIGWSTNTLPIGATETSSGYNAILTPTTQSITLAGGYRGSLRPTHSDLFTLTLVGNFGTSTVDFSNFTAKFQTILGAFTTQGTITCTGACGPATGTGGSSSGGTGSSVPEPSTLSILAAALLAALGYRLAHSRAAQPLPVKVRA